MDRIERAKQRYMALGESFQHEQAQLLEQAEAAVARRGIRKPPPAPKSSNPFEQGSLSICYHLIFIYSSIPDVSRSPKRSTPGVLRTTPRVESKKTFFGNYFSIILTTPKD